VADTTAKEAWVQQGRRYAFMFTFEDPDRPWWKLRPRAAFLIAVLGAGVTRLLAGARSHRALAIGSLAIVAFNWILHSFWGDELFLYSPHWQLALLVMLSGLLLPGGQGRWLGLVSLGGLLIGEVLNDASVLTTMMATLERASAR
jgi:hypothetical protein